MSGFGSLAQTPDEPYPEQGAGMPETYQSQAGRALANIGIGLTKAIWDIPRKLGQAAEVPVGLRREDVTDIPARHGITGTNQFGSEPQDELVEGTTGSAINRIGTGLPFAPRGVGAFGGKLAKPVEAVQSEVPHQSPYAGWHEAMEGIKAYHGSPHDFDRFDTSKIGTGEGAQAYGHGLYFAENEKVAKGYRDNLSSWPAIQKQVFNPDGTPNRPGQVAEWLSIGRPEHEFASTLKILDPNASEKQIADWISSGKDVFKKAGESGRMYEVNIKADPEHFLDWDKPLSEQSGSVRQALAGKPWAIPDTTAGAVLSGGKWIHPDDISGSELYRNIARKVAADEQARNPNFNVYNPHDAAQALRDAGIPGIKYLDQGSRNTLAKPSLVTNPDGTQQWATQSATGAVRRFSSKEAADKFWQSAEDRGRTHNYVVFDDKLIDILRKYGWAGLVGSAGLLDRGADAD